LRKAMQFIQAEPLGYARKMIQIDPLAETEQ
jgi:hypothetical protein